MKRAIRTHLSDFLAILALLVLSVVVAGYVLTKERLALPFISPSQFSINAAFSTAQAFTPGQGQTVVISGVQVGQVGNVTLNNGVAVVQLNIQQKYKGLIHQNATAIARPRTGLQDMFVELTPGGASSPLVNQGFTIPVSNTLPEVNLDEILSALDTDTRAYLDLLVNGAGQGLKGKGGDQLAQVLERFEPTHRDLARLNSALAVRGQDLRQLVNSLQRLNTAVAAKQAQIVSLVDASSKVFSATASEDANISRAISDLPGTLSQTTATLQQVETFAKELGPTARNLLPAAQALPAANNALIELAGPNATGCGASSSCAIVENQIRPFVRVSRPVVQNLRPAATNLASATPNLSKVFTVLNHFVNMAGYNTEPAGQHGYLYWLAWLNHNARTLFSIQDANGDFRPLFVQADCATYQNLLNLNSSAALILSPVIRSLCNLKLP